jgi:hypothetical protein
MSYIEEEEEKRKRKRGLMQPVEAVFDFLSRPQYAMANLATTIISAIRGDQPDVGAFQAIGEGLSGKRKGDFENVLFGGKNRSGEQIEGLFGGFEEEATGFFDPTQAVRNVGGFLANVVFDPLSWVGVGPTRGAHAAAREFAKRAVKLFFRKADDLGRLKTMVPEIADDVRRLVDAGDIEKATDLVRTKGTTDFAQEIAKRFSTATREGYRMTPQQAQQRFLTELTEERTGILQATESLAQRYQRHQLPRLQDQLSKARAAKDAKKITSLRGQIERVGATTYADEMGEKVARLVAGDEVKNVPRWLRDKVKTLREGRLNRLDADILATEAPGYVDELAGLGQRAAKVFTAEVGKHSRGPNIISRQFSQIGQRFRATPGGEKFTDAWWSVMNKGPVGMMRRALGFRNPYQRMLREIELEERAGLQAGVEESVKKVLLPLEGIDDATLNKYFQATAAAESRGPGTLLDDALDDETVARLGFAEGEKGTVMEIASKVKEITDEYVREYGMWRAAYPGAFSKGMNTIESYLPSMMRELGMFARPGKQKGSALPRPAMHRTFTLDETSAQEVAKFEMLLGVDQETARELVMGGASSQVTNVRELLAARAIAHEKMRSRISMLEQFREFGVHIDELRPQAALGEAFDVQEHNRQILHDAFTRRTGAMSQVGLQQVQDPFFKGFMFDREVSDILNRVVTVVDGDEGTKAVTSALRKYSAWWKSVVTTSPGFHFRNMYSNNITQFLRHGMDAFNPRYATPSLVATIKALHGDKGLTQARKFLGAARVNRALNANFGGYTAEQLSDLALRNGVISKQVMAGSQEQTIQKLAGTENVTALQKLNPFGQEFFAYRGSQELGAVVESVPRFQSFIMDIAKTAPAGKQATAAHLEWAKSQAKKWFLDYTDLTDFEQKVMKNWIPFYSWLRKNVVNQIQGIIEAPYMYAIIPKAQRAGQAFGSQEETDKGLLPKWMIDLGMFPVGEDQEGNPLMFRPNFPYQDLNILPVLFEGEEGRLIPRLRFSFEETIHDIANAAHPTLKSLVGYVTNQNIFRQEELEPDARAPRALRMLTNQTELLTFLDGVARTIFPNGQGLHIGQDDRGYLTMDGRIAYILENNIPVLKRFSEWLDLPIQLAEGFGVPIEKAIEAATGAKNDYDGLEAWFQVMSQNLGVKMKVLDKEQEELSRAWAIWNAAEARRREDRQELPGFEYRSNQARNRQMLQFRRAGLVQ